MTGGHPRFREELSPGRAEHTSLYFAILAGFLIWPLIFAVIGLWLFSERGIPTPLLGAIVGVGVITTVPIVVLDYALRYRDFVLEVRDDGIHYRGHLGLRTKHVPLERVTDVEWAEGTAGETDIFPTEDYNAMWDRYKESSKKSLYPNVVQHAWGRARRDAVMGEVMFWRKDMVTEGVVRVDSSRNTVYLFGTDSPERLANSIETAREAAT